MGPTPLPDRVPGGRLDLRHRAYHFLRRPYRAVRDSQRLAPLVQPLRNAFFALFHRYEMWTEACRERRDGLQTGGHLLPDASLSLLHDTTPYEPTPYWMLEQLRVLLPLSAEDVLLDVGCGKGRVVCFFAALPLRKVIGIDMAPELVAAARENAHRCRARTPIEIVEGDAATYDIRDCTVIYLYNPFGEATFARMLDHIRASLAAHPRPLRIVYTNPRCSRLLERQPWLRREAEYFDYIQVWRADAARATC